ncbi:carboxylate--amine ligase [Streptomyces griseomycini]|uniref:ATP-grasp superfamily ATP-dependent carboligase n=1 Tax=Streptomyces griseomycini TaxID=66895 RepID=A0A7W7PTB7_9ACTN|nr:ATP-grasp domain-containing protein [Streptomyces griseomycini]MBB4900936.1 putative ATP-grasp superfamily ATP-dependent carboligase [Streptomyces griseomycini]GGR15664.1 ATP-grasp domain-containing protein [Streptomyces griseomycini]
MPLLDTRVPAVLLRIDRNPFHHGTLGAVRSLGRAGVEVHVVADATGSPVHRSRYAHRMHPPPSPGAPEREILAALHRVAERIARPAVLVPLDDASAIAVSRARDDLAPSYLLPELPGALAERVADKAELAALCASADVPHPVTLVPDSPARAADDARRLGLPLVAKWSRPWLLPAGSGLRSTQVVRSAQQARELYLRTGEAGSRLLLQAYLPPGPDRDWFFHGYADRSGTVRAGGPGRKQLSWPRGAGLTAVGRWTPNPEVRALAERLVDALGYRGVLDLDFRRCGATGRYHLLDFNPRPGAQFRLFADSAGLDVVRALHLDLTGREMPDGDPVAGRAFVVENYAPFAALRTAPGGRELAWYARDDRGPGWAMWALWCRHVSGRLRERLAATAPVPAPRAIPRAASRAVSSSLTDNEKASS